MPIAHFVARTRRWRSSWQTLKMNARWLRVIRLMWVCLCSLWRVACDNVYLWGVVCDSVGYVSVYKYCGFDCFSYLYIGGQSHKSKSYPQKNCRRSSKWSIHIFIYSTFSKTYRADILVKLAILFEYVHFSKFVQCKIASCFIYIIQATHYHSFPPHTPTHTHSIGRGSCSHHNCQEASPTWNRRTHWTERDTPKRLDQCQEKVLIK